MLMYDLGFLRRKKIVGALAWVTFGLAWYVSANASPGDIAVIMFAIPWILSGAWVALDARSRGERSGAWVAVVLLTGPVALVLYWLVRRPMPPVCSRCGSAMSSQARPCPTCGQTTLFAKVCTVYSSLIGSLVGSPAEQARETAKQLAFALALVVVIGWFLLVVAGPRLWLLKPFVGLVVAVAAAAYWVLVPWWVYLDSTWRRMDGIPWAVLTLVTNVIGLVTYLVIRYPDPRTCVACGAGIPVGLKYCPFCGSEAEAMCPHCQAPVKPGWQFCPVCATRLTPGETDTDMSARPGPPWSIDVGGSIVDASGGSPIAGAKVEVDSLADGASVITDSLGRFQFSGLEQRPYVLVASAEGYVSQAKSYSPGNEDARHLRFALHRPVGQPLS